MGLAGMFVLGIVSLLVLGFVVYGIFLGISAMFRILVGTYRQIVAK